VPSPGRMLSAMACIAVAALCTASLTATQDPIRSGTRTVAVYATVTDAAGRLVPDLTRDDFEIFDNGKRQTITLFASEVQPITIVVLLDRSGSMATSFRFVEVAAHQFVRRLLPADKARIGSFAARIQLDPEDFTSDQDALIDVLRTEMQPAGPTPLWNAVNVGMTALSRQEGRRVVLVFTDGVDRPMNFSTRNVSLKDAMRRAAEENVMVYAIGLESRMRFGGPGYQGPGGRFGGSSRFEAVQKPDEGLAKIAAETGGGYFELTQTDDLISTFRRVADELHRQYALGFEPAALDGKTHKLELRIRREGLTARARKNYVAGRER